MYSREKRMKAVELYIKYDKSAADTIRELGYPSRHTLRSWYELYLREQETGVFRNRYIRASKFTEEQKQSAVRHYLDHGLNYSRTSRGLGYPNRETLRQWCRELAPDRCRKGNCWDNAPMESFFGTLKTECVYARKKYKTRAEAKSDIFRYIEIFYNRKRLHSGLGYKTPESYEKERLQA